MTRAGRGAGPGAGSSPRHLAGSRAPLPATRSRTTPPAYGISLGTPRIPRSCLPAPLPRASACSLRLRPARCRFSPPCVLPLVARLHLDRRRREAFATRDRGGTARARAEPPVLCELLDDLRSFLGLSATADRLGADPEQGDGSTASRARSSSCWASSSVASSVVPALGRGWHVERLLERAGRGGPLVAGAAFAVAWTPCLGPTLTAILALASETHSRGARRAAARLLLRRGWRSRFSRPRSRSAA